MKFNRYALSDLATIKYGKNQKKVLSESGNIPIYGTGGLMGYATTALYDKPSVLIGRKGTIGKVKYVEHPFWTVDTLFYTIVNTDIVLPKYLYYVMSLIDLNNYNEGTTIPSLRTETLNRLEFDIPSLVEQETILSCLNPIDEKNALNNAINNNLEQQAMALYENTFCTPSNIAMKHISLSDLMDYSGGSQPPASKFIFIKRDGYIRFVQIRDYDTDSHITYIPESAKNKLCEEHDIMIARYGASLGRICFGINGAYNVALAKVFPKKSYFREFLRCYLSSRTFYEGINNKGGRSAQAGFNQSDINSFELDFPIDEAIVQKFENTVAPMFEQRLQLRKENQRLASLRDTLLPKLMSGELDVSDIDL